MLGSGRYGTALVVGAEKMSSIMDWEDWTTCVLFGDGAGAVVLSRKGMGQACLALGVERTVRIHHAINLPEALKVLLVPTRLK